MRFRVTLYVIAASLALIGFPMVLVLFYLNMINSGIDSTFFWAAAVACCLSYVAPSCEFLYSAFVQFFSCHTN